MEGAGWSCTEILILNTLGNTSCDLGDSTGPVGISFPKCWENLTIRWCINNILWQKYKHTSGSYFSKVVSLFCQDCGRHGFLVLSSLGGALYSVHVLCCPIQRVNCDEAGVLRCWSVHILYALWYSCSVFLFVVVLCSAENQRLC